MRSTAVRSSVLSPLQGLSDAELRDVTLVAYHKWCITRRFLNAVDRENKQAHHRR